MSQRWIPQNGIAQRVLNGFPKLVHASLSRHSELPTFAVVHVDIVSPTCEFDEPLWGCEFSPVVVPSVTDGNECEGADGSDG
jgi:hypothetical protein